MKFPKGTTAPIPVMEMDLVNESCGAETDVVNTSSIE
jgi:hypothetical protein